MSKAKRSLMLVIAGLVAVLLLGGLWVAWVVYDRELTAHKLLLSAIEHGQIKAVDKLTAEYPRIINQPDAFGRSVLHRAVKFRRHEILRLLRRRGAEDTPDRFGRTALAFAIERNDADAITILESSARDESE